MKKAVLVATLAIVMVLSVAASAYAATDNVVISAQINSKITVTAPADHDFGPFDPDAADPAPYAGNVNVRSNVDYTLARSFTSNTFPAGMLSINTPAGMDGVTMNPKAPSAGGFDWAQAYTLTVAPGGVWQDPGSYSADVLYTALP